MHVPQLLSLCSGAWGPHLLSPCASMTAAFAPRTLALQQEKPPQREACAPKPEVSPRSPKLEKLVA